MYWRTRQHPRTLAGIESYTALSAKTMTLVNDTALVSLTGYSRAATVVVAIAFALMMVEGYDIFIRSFVAPLVAQELHLAASRLGELFAAGLLGSMLGGL